MERLRELAKKLGNPGADKLYIAARKRGIPATRSQVKQLISAIGSKQTNNLARGEHQAQTLNNLLLIIGF